MPAALDARENRFLLSLVAAYSLFFFLAQETAWLLWRRSLTGEVTRFLVWYRDIPLAFVVAAVTVALSRFSTARFSWARTLEARFRELIGPLSSPAVLGLALFSALGEEAVFRGILQPLVGLVPASLVFGLLHLPVERSLWPWTVFAILMGLVLGSLYLWTGHLATPFLAHFGINLLNLRRIAAEP